MSGFITIERDIWDHPIFAPGPMTEREAWMWMLARAAYKDTRHRVGSELVDVPRGSFMVTLREMQSVFMWGSDKRVRTFLKTLEKEGMIGRTTVGARNAPKTHVTICKYEEYQSRGRTKDAPRTHERTHQGRTTDAVKKQRNKVTIEEPKGSLSPDGEIRAAFSAYNESAKGAGWPEAQVLNAKRRTGLKARLKDAGGIEGWNAALARARASPLCCGDNNRGWVADLDFFLQQKSFTRLMEGSYDARSQPNGQSGGNRSNGGQRGPHNSFMAGFAHVANQGSG